MTQEQIEKYEYCKKDIQQLKEWKEKLPFGPQNHGCGSQRPSIEHELEEIHRKMCQEVHMAMQNAIVAIEKRIKDL